ncbi:mercury transporter MerT [Bradyrhizobium centrolobii]|uniref:Mercuric transport protein MerT n=2 Tax=Bradyrhizobium centrolobii TaxID=1505087 RepID=A0A176Z8H7_9BRAD|nr:mercury transporter MerT [Bradyrhizobium centrolobii]
MERSLDPVVTTGCSVAGMTVKEHFTAASGRGQAITAAGGLLGALAASSCCIMPVALFSLGISGAWIGNFTQLAPFQPYFLAATLLCLGAGYWLVHRASKCACAAGEACAQPLPNRLVKGMLVIATVLVVAAIGFDLLAPLLLNS